MFRLVPKEFAILHDLLPADFTIELKDGNSYKCHYFTAAAYSLVVQGLAAVDPEQRSITIDLPDQCGQFPLIVTLLEGGEIEIAESNMFFLCAAASTLRISRLLNASRRFMKSDGIVPVEMEDGFKFNGVVCYLRDTYGYEVTVDASSSEYSGLPESVLQPHSFWESEDKPNQSIVFDFGEHPVRVTGYIMESADRDDERHPESWMVIGSNDMEDWFEIDQRDDSHSLMGRAEVAYFQAEGESPKPARYVKVFMTEVNGRGDWVFRLGRIEFFGEVTE